jgi:hypothetical protein
MSEATAAEAPKVMEKVFNILKKELSKEEYLIYLQAITPRIGDATKELRELTKKMSLEDILQKAKKTEKTLNVHQ